MGPSKWKDLPQLGRANLSSQVILSKGTSLLPIVTERPQGETQRKPLQIHPRRIQASGKDHRQQGDTLISGKGLRCKASSLGPNQQEKREVSLQRVRVELGQHKARLPDPALRVRSVLLGPVLHDPTRRPLLVPATERVSPVMSSNSMMNDGKGRAGEEGKGIDKSGLGIIEEKDQTLLILLLNSTSEMGWLTTTFS